MIMDMNMVEDKDMDTDTDKDMYRNTGMSAVMEIDINSISNKSSTLAV
jgi:hypothetical protein